MHDMMNTVSYDIPSGVHMRLIDERLVFLDLRRDKYLCLSQADSGAATSALRHLLTGYAAPMSMDVKIDESAKCVIDELLRQGLVTKGLQPRPQPTDEGLISPKRDLGSTSNESTATLPLGDVLRFSYATTSAAAKLAWLPIERTVNGLCLRKRRHNLRATTPIDWRKLRNRVAVFNRLRPLFPHRYKCLFDSLALLEFLALHDIFPTLVFGVTAEPFFAHCWLQQDDVVLNDTIEYVFRFSEIMSV